MNSPFFGSILCGFLFLALSPLSRAEGEPVRLAVAGTPEAPALNDLITADLTAAPGFALVERAQLDKVASEFKLGSLGYSDTLKLGSQLGARGVLVLGGMPASDNQWRFSARLVDTRTGVIVWSQFLGFPMESGKPRIPDLPALAARLSAAVIGCRDRLAAAPGSLAPVSYLNLKSVFYGWGARAIDRDLNTLVMGYLEHDPSICILERQALDLAAWEKSVNAADASPFWTGRVVVSGAIEAAATDATQLVIHLKIQKAGGSETSAQVHGSRDNLPALAQLIANTIAAAAVPNGAPIPPVEMAAEAKEAADAAWQAAEGRADWQIASGLARTAWVFSGGDKQYLGLYIRSLGWIVSAQCEATQAGNEDFLYGWLDNQIAANQLALDGEPELLGRQFDAAIEATALLLDRKADTGSDYIRLACEVQGRATALLVVAAKRPNRGEFDSQRMELQSKLSQLSKAILDSSIISDGSADTADYLQGREQWSEYLDGNRQDWLDDMKRILSIPIERYKFHYGWAPSYRSQLFEWPWSYQNGIGFHSAEPQRELSLYWTADPVTEGRLALRDLAAWLPGCDQPEGRLLAAQVAAQAGVSGSGWDVALANISAVVNDQIHSQPVISILQALHDSGNVPPERAAQVLEKTVEAFQQHIPNQWNDHFLIQATDLLAPSLSQEARRTLRAAYARAIRTTHSDLIINALNEIPPAPGDAEPSATPNQRPPNFVLGKPDYAPADEMTETSLNLMYSNAPKYTICGGKFWFIEYPNLDLVGLWPGLPVERIPLPAPRTDEEVTWLGAVHPVAASDRWIVLESQHVAADWSLLVYDRRSHSWHRGTKFPAASFVKGAAIDGDELYFNATDPRRGGGPRSFGQALFLRLKLPDGPTEVIASEAADLPAITKNAPHTDVRKFAIAGGKIYLAGFQSQFSLDLQTLEWTPISKEAFQKAVPPDDPGKAFGALRVNYVHMTKSDYSEQSNDEFGNVLTMTSSKDGSQLCLATDPRADVLFVAGDTVALASENNIWFVKRSDLEAKAWKLNPSGAGGRALK